MRERGVILSVVTDIHPGMPDQVHDDVCHFGSVGLVRAEGQWYCILTEGVGYPIPDGDWLSQVKSKEVDLADYIRTFGARLESNFYLWFRKLWGNN